MALFAGRISVVSSSICALRRNILDDWHAGCERIHVRSFLEGVATGPSEASFVEKALCSIGSLCVHLLVRVGIIFLFQW